MIAGFINPFLGNAPILYSLKTPKKQRFTVVFRGYNMGALAQNRSTLIYLRICNSFIRFSFMEKFVYDTTKNIYNINLSLTFTLNK